MILSKFKSLRQLLILGICAVVIGAVTGALDAGFGEILIYLTEVRERFFLPLILFLPAAGVVIAKSYSMVGGKCVKGMGLIFSVGHGEEDVIPLRLIPLTVIGTWMTHLFGGSAGREGVAVQIGATFSHWVGRKMNMVSDSKIFLVTGMAAGFSGLFQTPIAACFFALEVLIAGSLQYTALFPAIIAAFVANAVSRGLGLEKFHYDLQLQIQMNPVFIIKMILLGIIFGLVGAMFAHGLKLVKERLNKVFESPIRKIAIVGTILVILFIVSGMGRYSGLGTNLISAGFHGSKIYQWDWILKFILTIITLAAGYQGGEVTPLFAIGSSLGAAIAVLIGLPVEFAAALGYTAVFGSATNTLLAPVFIGAEVFGYSYVPYFFMVCCVAYVFNDNKSIYAAQKNLQDML
ncbi:voltage-gated chloride channel protein [Lacrimispora amygdalina]|uniref:Voltage-gated chloride channel protein n=1 Tax=Lacrimispora amygdalina TaxID=253257 RepID=A0A3E2N7E7_9FIRM|nr:chloride channel protein [Clostridium indicum]RFZ76929.1 voltage-gated chloride channel protein [Clostridium indicum]